MTFFGNCQVTQLPMNLVTGWLASWSLMQLAINVTIDILSVRRSSDNAVTTVKYDTAGKISSTSLVGAGGNLGTWAGVSNLFVTSVTDLSGNGRNLAMATLANQPQLVLNALGGQAVMRFAGAQQLIMSSAFNANWNTLFTVHNIANTAARGIIFGNQVDTPTQADSSGVEKRANNTARINWGGANLILGLNLAFSATPCVFSFFRDAVTPLNADYISNSLDVSNATVVIDIPNTVAHGVGADRRSASPASAIPLTGDVAAIMVYSNALNTQRSSVASALGRLCGVNV